MHRYKMKKTSQYLKLALVPSLFAVSTSAFPYSVVVTNPFAISTPIVTAIGAQTTSLLASLELIRQEIAAGASGNLSATGGSELAGSMNQEIQSSREAEMAKVERMSEAERGFGIAVDPCTTGETAEAVDGAKADTGKRMTKGGGGRGGGSKRVTPPDAPAPDAPPSVKQFLDNAALNAPESIDKNVARTAKLHREKYCTQDELSHPGTRIQCEGRLGVYPNAIVEARSLLRGAKKPAENQIENLSFNGDQRNIAQTFITLITKPNGVFRPLTKEESTHPSATQYFGLMKEYEARTNFGEYVLDSSLARRVPSAKTKKYLASIEETVGSQPWYIERKKANNNYKDGLSELDMIDLDVAKRYSNAQWHIDLAKMENKEGEIATILAQQNHILLMQFRQMEISNLIAAQQLINAEKAYFTPIFASLANTISASGASQKSTPAPAAPKP